MKSKRRIRAKVDAAAVINTALDSAIESAMNKTDKYNPEALTDGQRATLTNHLSNYFWLAIEDAGVEIR